MKRIISIIFILLITLNSGYAQESNKNLFVGLEDNQYGIAGLEYNKWQLGVKHSIFSENIENQYFQFNLGYSQPFKNYATFLLTGYGGSVYNGKFYTVDANLLSEFYPLNKLTLYLELQPHYDSGMDYKTCYGFGTKYQIAKEVSLKASFESIPEYRISEKRIKLGVIFNSNNLYVLPEISIPTKGSQHKVRVLCSFRLYVFKLKCTTSA